MNLSVIAVAEELSEPDFTHHADSTGSLPPPTMFSSVSSSILIGYITWPIKLFPNPSSLSVPFLTSFCEFQKLTVMTMLIGQSWYEAHTQVYTVYVCTSGKNMFLKF